MSDRLHIVLPVESLARELDSRLLLAGQLINREHRAFVAFAPTSFHLTEEIPGGVYVGKHLFSPTTDKPDFYYRAKDRGWKVLHLSEEGAVYPDAEPQWQYELDFQLKPQLVHEDDLVCTWGNFQRDHYQLRAPDKKDRIRTTGHPRFDLYQPKYRDLFMSDVENIRQRFGNFVLVNSNFTEIVNAQGPHGAFAAMNGYVPTNDQRRLRYVGFWSRVARTVPEYVELLHRLSIARKDINIVVRPHPGDDIDWFKGVFNGVPNIHVVREGSVAAWLLACNVMVQAGCTTALEAHLMGTPTVTYTPTPDSGHEFYLPSLFGHRVTTQDAALEAIQKMLEPRYDSHREGEKKTLPDRARNMFSNFDEDSTPRFLAAVEEQMQAARRHSVAPSRTRLKLSEARLATIERGKSVVRGFFWERYLSAKHVRGVFPGMSRSHVERVVRIVNKLTKNDLSVRYYSQNLFELTSTR